MVLHLHFSSDWTPCYGGRFGGGNYDVYDDLHSTRVVKNFEENLVGSNVVAIYYNKKGSYDVDFHYKLVDSVQTLSLRNKSETAKILNDYRKALGDISNTKAQVAMNEARTRFEEFMSFISREQPHLLGQMSDAYRNFQMSKVQQILP